jgi:hypothetical protein
MRPVGVVPVGEAGELVFEGPLPVGNENPPRALVLERLDESVRSFLTEASHPGGDGRRCHEHVCGRLFEGPGSGGPQLEDGETLHGLIVGPPMAWARAAVSANCASEMACRTAERTRSFQCLGRGRTG